MIILNMPANWEEFSKRLLGRYSKLTADDLLIIDGKEEEMIERVQLRLGRSRESILALFERMRLIE